MRSWLKSKKWAILNALVLSVMLTVLGVQVADKPASRGISVGNWFGGEKVITLGPASAFAAGSVDYTFDGVADNVQFQAALNALPATGGRLVIVSATTIVFAATVTRAISNVTIEGSGRGTYFTYDGVNPIFTAGSNNWKFLNLRTDAGSLDMGATTGWEWNNTTIANTYYAYRTPVASTSAPSWEIPTGRGAAIFVSASDASLNSRAQADYYADGTADEVTIQAALDALPAGGGKVLLSEGTFNLAASVDHDTNYRVLEGQGYSTELKVVANNVKALITTGGPTVEVSNLRINGNRTNFTSTSGIYMNDGNATLTLRNIWIENTYNVAAGVATGSALGSPNTHVLYKGTYSRTLIVDGLYLTDNIGSVGLYDVVNATFKNVRITGSSSNENYSFLLYRSQSINLSDYYINTAAGYGLSLNYFKNANLNNMYVRATGAYNVINILGGARGNSANANLTNIIATGGGGGQASGVSDGLDFEGLQYLTLTNITCYDNGSDGIEIDADTEYQTRHIALTNVNCYNNGSAGLLLSDADNVSVINSTFVNNTVGGIAINGATGASGSQYITIQNSRIGDTQATAAKALTGTSAAGTYYLNIDGTTDVYSFFPDQKIQIVDGALSEYNWVVRSFTDGAPGYIEVKNALANQYTNTGTVQGIAIQPYGIVTTSADTKYLTFENNDFRGNTSGVVSFAFGSSDATWTYRNNTGYQTESFGTATVANGTTSIAVNHNLAVTPSQGEIQVTPTNDLGNATKYWVNTLGAAQFTINVDVDPGVGTATFAWKAKVR